MKNHIYLSLLSMFILCGCLTQSQRIEKYTEIVGGVEFVAIGVLGGIDSETEAIVTDSLHEIGIQCYMQGGLMYDVLVLKTQYKEALKKLQNEPKLKGKRFRFI